MCDSKPDQTVGQCPYHQTLAKGSGLTGAEELLFPFNKRAIVQYAQDEHDVLELHIYYDDKEISFDEPSLFAFGETLAKQSRFIAKSAMTWGDGYAWSDVKPLLEHLLEEGILQHADSCDAQIQQFDQHAVVASPLPVAKNTDARTWHECESISFELVGRELPLAYLELVIPVFRIAHIWLDAEGRQVGEANVFPPALRLDVETEWKTCPYPGSRYLDQRPMNVTALRSMGHYWPQMMAALLPIREAYLNRYPGMRQGWTVGGIEALANSVLAVVTYPLIRGLQPLQNGQLHPVLSSLFRVTDGLRMVTHQMMFVPVGEATLPTDAPMTCREIYDYSERNYAFSSTYGVCAGPRTMIEDFLNVLIDGIPSKEADGVILEPAVFEALNDVEVALDYGLLGLQAHAAMFSIWPAMTRCYVQLAEIIGNWSAPRSSALVEFQDRLQQHIHVLNTQTHHAKEAWRSNREHAYADIYRYSAQGLKSSANSPSLPESIATRWNFRHQTLNTQLRDVLRRFCAVEDDNPDLQHLLDCLLNFLLNTQAIIAVACEVQQSINNLLDRAESTSSFNARMIDIHNALQGEDVRKLPFILDELERALNIDILIDVDRIEFSPRHQEIN